MSEKPAWQEGHDLLGEYSCTCGAKITYWDYTVYDCLAIGHDDKYLGAAYIGTAYSDGSAGEARRVAKYVIKITNDRLNKDEGCELKVVNEGALRDRIGTEKVLR